MAGRQRTLIVPREHGAWGILLVPLVTGAGAGLLAGGSAAGLAPLCLAALAVFWLRTPVESWAGTTPIRARTAEEFNLVRTAVALLAAIAGGSLAWLFWGGKRVLLLWVGAAAGASFLAQAGLKRVRREARTAAQMIGAAGLTATAPAAYYVVTGDWNAAAWSLWAANLLFAINQIHFVQLRIHGAQSKTRSAKVAAGRSFLAGQGILIALLIAACAWGFYSWYAACAFVPILARGFAWFLAKPRALAIRALGKSELAYSCVFGVLLVIGGGVR